MRRLYNGTIILDSLDLLFISFSGGSLIAYGFRKYQDFRNIRIVNDPLIHELKRKSPIQMFSEKGKFLRLPLPLIRGGENIEIFSLVFDNKKLALRMASLIRRVRVNQKKLRVFQTILFILNSMLTSSIGVRIAVEGSLDFTQIILICIPSGVAGFLIELLNTNPLISIILPLAILFSRGVEDISHNNDQKCKLICKAIEEYHNKKLILEMKNGNLIVENLASLVSNELPLHCIEEPLSLVERYKLKEVIKSVNGRKRVQHFSEFIKKFPECDPNPEAMYREITGNI